MKRKLTLSSAAAVLLALAGCAEEQKPAPTAAADAAKAQAEADGNGRTGRVLNSFFLVEQDLLPLPILPFDRKIIAHKADYYRLLLAVTREGAWEPWLRPEVSFAHRAGHVPSARRRRAGLVEATAVGEFALISWQASSSDVRARSVLPT